MLRFSELVQGSLSIARVRSRSAKIELLSELLRRLEPAERAIGSAYLAGELPQGRVGVGYRTVAKLATEVPFDPTLASPTLLEVDAALTKISAAEGPGSQARKNALLTDLYRPLTPPERGLLSGLFVGEVRQGALAALLLEAVAVVSRVASADLRRAAMLAGSDLEAARVALTEGPAALSRFKLRPGTPMKPMLASPADDVGVALETFGAAARFDVKLDGARLQIHKDGDQIALFSRSLHDVTARCPEIVAFARALPAAAAILDGEAIALRDASGAPHAFQTTMRRFGRQHGVAELAKQLPLSPFVFDVMMMGTEELFDAPLSERLARLARVVPEAARVAGITSEDPEEVESFYDEVVAKGHEGLMGKSLSSTYEAGHRGSQWLKLKPAHTLDLVVLAVERGSGRRHEWLSNLHLGARDPAGGFAMIGKTFKGMTDEMLRWQTRRFEELAVRQVEDAPLGPPLGGAAARWGSGLVEVRPEQVVEVAFNDVQHSSEYSSGAALRFARVRRYRMDKSAADANTLEEVRALLPKL